jgi:UDP-3-O-[3-hydroxymyristoyl] glucosamine N-acyltransferase
LSLTLKKIADAISADLVGDDLTVEGVATLEEADANQVSFCFDQRKLSELHETKAAAVVVPKKSKEIQEQAPCSVLLVEQPRLALSKLLEVFYPPRKIVSGIQPGAFVDSAAIVDSSVRVEPGARIEAGVEIKAGTLISSGVVVSAETSIGQDCRIGPNSVIGRNCRIGNRVVLAPAVVVGSDGFGFVTDGEQAKKIPQIGNVIIEDDVEIGAGTTIDRATLGTTRIGAGTKIDNLVQVGHNVEIGKNVIIAAQVGLSGSVIIGDRVVLGGQVGVADHIKIGPGAQVGAKSGVGSHVPAGARVAGYPAVPIRQWLKNVFIFRRLDKLLERRQKEGEIG